MKTESLVGNQYLVCSVMTKYDAEKINSKECTYTDQYGIEHHGRKITEWLLIEIIKSEATKGSYSGKSYENTKLTAKILNSSNQLMIGSELQNCWSEIDTQGPTRSWYHPASRKRYKDFTTLDSESSISGPILNMDVLNLYSEECEGWEHHNRSMNHLSAYYRRPRRHLKVDGEVKCWYCDRMKIETAEE